MNEEFSYSSPDPRTRFQKLRGRFFPAKHCFAPNAPKEFKDRIHGHAVTKLSWGDRIRVMLTGVVVTQWRTVTENEVGRTVNASKCWVGTSQDLILLTTELTGPERDYDKHERC